MVVAVNGVQSGASYSGFSQGSMLESLQDQFMKILLTELKYQDPLEPINEKDFFAQMAQFTTATQMESMNSNLTFGVGLLTDMAFNQQFLSASSLVGKQFQAVVDGARCSGVIESVSLQNGQITLKGGDETFPLACLVFVGGDKSADTPD